MAEFKLNEEQENLMKKFSDDANSLIEKYRNMKEAFKVTSKKISAKTNSSDDERMEEVNEEIECLQRQASSVIEALGKINYIARGHDGYKSAASLLLAVQHLISDVMYELGKLEGYSSREISTYGDTFTLKRNYNALEKSLLG